MLQTAYSLHIHVSHENWAPEITDLQHFLEFVSVIPDPHPEYIKYLFVIQFQHSPRTLMSMSAHFQ